MIDTHAHLDFESFDKDRDEVIRRAFASGIEKIINVGDDLETSRKSVDLARRYERTDVRMYAAIGFHPYYFSEGGKVELEELRKLAEDDRIVAIGEIGLDYFAHGGEEVSNEKRERQKEGFIAQLELATELELPVVIHCRDAYEDAYEIIKKYDNLRMVLHCYSGDLDFTKKFLLQDNIHFSFTGNITYKIKKNIEGTKDDIQESIKTIPLERIMLDSDCPFLSPQEKRGERNEPANISFIADKISSIKEVLTGEVEKQTTKNAVNFFNLK